MLDEGRRLAASYANFLIINGAVLMPAYGDANDDAAAAVDRRTGLDRDRFIFDIAGDPYPYAIRDSLYFDAHRKNRLSYT